MKTNEPNNYSREVSREVHSDPETNAYTSTTRSSETVNSTAGDSPRAGYDEGSAHGRVSESYRQAGYQDVRDNQTAARGLLLGIILTSLAALAGGTQTEEILEQVSRHACQVPAAPLDCGDEAMCRQAAAL